MIFLTFHHGSDLRLGVKHRERVIDLAGAAAERGGEVPRTPQELITRGLEAVALVESLLESLASRDPEPSVALDESELIYGPPIPSPGKIVCVGRNYRKHAAEMEEDVPTEPLLFSKFGNAIAACGQAVDITGLEQVDYEAELAVVIGERCKQIPESEALGHVLGYTNANDVSERALQYRSSQFLIGKSLDGFLPIGPYLVTADELVDPQDLDIRGWLNGELRQESHTSKMVFSVAQIVSYVSRLMTLDPGDLILTGTPEGVIKGTDDKMWIASGDEYVVEVGPLGKLKTRFEAI